MADTLTLIIGNKNFSSWSLRPYLALAEAGLPFEEVLIRLDQPDSRALIVRHSPSGRVPALIHGDLVIWDSLSILEYLAETFPEAKLWPADRRVRAWARSVSTEMHAGFADLRRELPMDLRARTPRVPSPAAAADIQRILASWEACREAFGAKGPFLFGDFSIADCMYAPVVGRFVTYDVPVSPVARAYMDAIGSLPAMLSWVEAARREPVAAG